MFTVMPYQSVLRYRRGALLDVLTAGRHRTSFRRDRLVWVDLRTSILELAPQEVVTADGIRVKATASMTWKVIDPQAWHEVAADPYARLYDAAKVALREVVRATVVDEVMATPAEPEPTSVVEAAREVGVEVGAFSVRDVIVPAELRRAAEALVSAQKAAQTRLEEARGEAASLRALANAASVLDQHPVLATLRIAQAVGESGGTLSIERPSA